MMLYGNRRRTNRRWGAAKVGLVWMLFAQLDHLIELPDEVATRAGLFFVVVLDDASPFVSRTAMEKNLHP